MFFIALLLQALLELYSVRCEQEEQMNMDARTVKYMMHATCLIIPEVYYFPVVHHTYMVIRLHL